MKGCVTPTHSKNERGGASCYDFDPLVDFSEFLEEARKQTVAASIPTTSPYSVRAAKEKPKEEKRSKKSWKRSLFSWWKFDKKGKRDVQRESNYTVTNKPRGRQGYSSGPIYGSGEEVERKPRHQTSGPLAGLFNPNTRAQNETSYDRLYRLDPRGAPQPYGPVYLVT